MKQFRISAKNLAHLNLDDKCLRCFWYLLRLRHKTPFNIFPGIFSTFDAIQKHLVEECIANTGKFPAWLGEISKASSIADTPPRMELTHHGTNIILVGVPDHVFEWSDGTVSPIDYKTARYSKGQDALKPLYEAQLDAYAYLLSEKCNLESDHGALVYFEPATPDTATLTEDGYIQPWQVHVAGVEVSGQTTLDLLDYAREIYESKTAPDGRAECFDCDLLDKLSSVVTRENTSRDYQLRFMNPKERSIYAATESFKRFNLKSLDSTVSTRPVQGTSVLMNWDWSN